MGRLLSPRLALGGLAGLMIAAVVVTLVRAASGPDSAEPVEQSTPAAGVEPDGGNDADAGEAGEARSVDGEQATAAGEGLASGAGSVEAAVRAVMGWFEMVATEPEHAELQRRLEEIATPAAVARTAELAQSDEVFVAYRTRMVVPEWAQVVADSIIAVRALSARIEPLGENRAVAEVWYTTVRVVPSRTGEATYSVGRFEFVKGQDGWLLDSPAWGPDAEEAAVAPSVVRAADSVAMAADETLARLAGHGPVRGDAVGAR